MRLILQASPRKLQGALRAVRTGAKAQGPLAGILAGRIEVLMMTTWWTEGVQLVHT